MSAKVRCDSKELRTAQITFATTDRVTGTFEWIAATRTIVHFLDDVDISVDAEGAVCYEASGLLVTKTTGTAWTAGQRIFYSPTGNTFHTSTTSVLDVVAGTCIEDAASAATEALAHFVGDPGRRPQMSGAGL
jgi:hypothetical protein